MAPDTCDPASVTMSIKLGLEARRHLGTILDVQDGVNA